MSVGLREEGEGSECVCRCTYMYMYCVFMYAGIVHVHASLAVSRKSRNSIHVYMSPSGY